MSCSPSFHLRLHLGYNLVLTGPCGLPAIPPITIHSVAAIIWVFAVSLTPTALAFSLKHFQHCFSALMLFEGNWSAEIARTSCAGHLLGNKTVICNGPATILGWAELTSMLSCNS